MGPIYRLLGLTVGAIQSDMGTPSARRPTGRHHLRHEQRVRLRLPPRQHASRQADLAQREFHYAIIDEVDNILIDEARTPLIISGPANESTRSSPEADRIARQFKKDEHFEVNEKSRTVPSRTRASPRPSASSGVESFYDRANMEWPHHRQRP